MKEYSTNWDERITKLSWKILFYFLVFSMYRTLFPHTVHVPINMSWKYMSGNILFQCYQLITSHHITSHQIRSDLIRSYSSVCYNVAAVAVKLLIEEITRYCTVMLRSLQGEPCLTFHLNTVIVTRLIDRNTLGRPLHTPHPTPTTRLHRIG